jgi:peptidyl-prolyl cis-trans isomerase C/peptidyl-prolyl cis-trans isomerase SurA
MSMPKTTTINIPAQLEEPEKAHVRHILLMTIDPAGRQPIPLSTNAVAAKRNRSKTCSSASKRGEDFAKLTTGILRRPAKENGGELLEFPRGQMVPEFEAAAFALSKDQISDVVVTAYGFHIASNRWARRRLKKWPMLILLQTSKKDSLG